MSDYARFRERFAEALDPRLHTMDWLDQQVAFGRALLWFEGNSAILARIKDYPTGARAIHGLYATGDLTQITETLIPQAEDFGRRAGCDTAFIDSREAWERVLAARGYRPYKIAVRKDL